MEKTVKKVIKQSVISAQANEQGQKMLKGFSKMQEPGKQQTQQFEESGIRECALYKQSIYNYRVCTFLERVKLQKVNISQRIIDSNHVKEIHKGQLVLLEKYKTTIFMQPIILFQDASKQGEATNLIIDGQHRIQLFETHPDVYKNELIQVMYVISKSPDLRFAELFHILHSDKPQNPQITTIRQLHPAMAQRFDFFDLWFTETFDNQLYKSIDKNPDATKRQVKKFHSGRILAFLITTCLTAEQSPDYKDFFDIINEDSSNNIDILIRVFTNLNIQWCNKHRYNAKGKELVTLSKQPKQPHKDVCFIGAANFLKQPDALQDIYTAFELLNISK